jgi:hypothetical protein
MTNQTSNAPDVKHESFLHFLPLLSVFTVGGKWKRGKINENLGKPQCAD